MVMHGVVRHYLSVISRANQLSLSVSVKKPMPLSLSTQIALLSRILGMGDVLSLIEEVEMKVDKQKAEKMAKKVMKGGGFTLEDFADQLRQMKNMGGMMGMLDKFPGMANIPDTVKDQVGDKALIKWKRLLTQ